MQETWGQSLGQEDPLEKETATRSSILAWEISWTEEPGRPQSIGSKKSQTRLSIHTHTHTFIVVIISHSLVARLVKNPPAMWKTWI